MPRSINPTFLTIARQGRSSRKHYLVGTLLTFGVTLVILIAAVIASAYISGISSNNPNVILYGNPLRAVLFEGLVGGAWLLGLFLAVTRVHRRKFMTLFGVEAGVDWSRVIKGFILWLGLYGIGFLLSYLIFPSRYSLAFNISEWLPFALLALICAPVLSLVRILFVYGYLLQAVGLLVVHPLVLSIVFGLVYGSLAIGFKMPIYWIIGVFSSSFISWMVIKDNRIELAIGMDIAVSLISLLFLSHPDYLIKAPTVFKSTSLPDLSNLIFYVLRSGLFYYFCFGRQKDLPRSAVDD